MGMHEHQAYEVQVHVNGRWQTEVRCAHNERARAIFEAKDIAGERQDIAVRVILDDYNPETGRHRESVVYRNKVDPATIKVGKTKRANNWADMAVSSNGRVGYLREEIDFFLGEDEVERPKVRVSTGMFFGICMMIATVGLGGGLTASGLLYLMIKAFDISQADEVQKLMLMGMFALVSLIAASSMYSHYAARFDLNIFKRKPKPTVVAAQPTKISKDMQTAARAIDKMQPAEASSGNEVRDDFRLFEQSEIDEAESKTHSEPVKEYEKVELSDEAQKQKMFLINFLGTCLGALKGPDASTQTLNRFGLNLFMSGAVMKIAQNYRLNEAETDEILRRLLEMLGSKADQVESFLSELDVHLEHPRHLALFEKGGKIAFRFSDGDQSAPLYVRATMEEWVHWKPRVEIPVNPNLLTIMFTDMVGSTDLTTRHGDYAAQEVLKTHDLIVRTALTNFEGKEIKHLGDGIMASFKNHDDALDAAVEIHKRIDGNNNASPEFPLHIRIGLHAGEPLRKNNDLFGTAVQLAARLCDFTPSDSICISKALKDLCGEFPAYNFEDLGLQKLKGFEELQSIYKLDWTAPAPIYEDEVLLDGSDGAVQQESVGDVQAFADVQDGVAPDMAIVSSKTQKKPVHDPHFAEGLKFQTSATETAPTSSGQKNDPKGKA